MLDISYKPETRSPERVDLVQNYPFTEVNEENKEPGKR